VTVPEFPGSAAILAASGAGETPALPGKIGPEVRCGACSSSKWELPERPTAALTCSAGWG